MNKKTDKSKKLEVSAVVKFENQFLLHKRPIDAIQGGLWEFPSVSCRSSSDCYREFELLLQKLSITCDCDDMEMHSIVDGERGTFWFFYCTAYNQKSFPEDRFVWVTKEELLNLKISPPMKKLLIG